jgi:hypothetical protein
MSRPTSRLAACVLLATVGLARAASAAPTAARPGSDDPCTAVADLNARRQPGFSEARMGECDERKGRPVEARSHYLAAASSLPRGGARHRFVETRLRAIEARLVEVRVVAVPSAPPPIEGVVFTRSPAAAIAPTVPVAHGGSPPLRVTGIVLTFAGAAGLGIAGASGWLVREQAKTARAECDDLQRCSRRGLEASREGQDLSRVSTAAAIGGAAALVVGITLFLVSGPRTSRAVTVGTLPSSLVAVGRF